MENNLLMTPQEVIDLMLVENRNTSVDNIKPIFIFTAQINHIKPSLGESFYYSLVEKKQSDTLTTEETELINVYLKPALAAFTIASTLTNTSNKVTNAGYVKTEGKYFSNSSFAERKNDYDSKIGMGNTLLKEAVKFIENNALSFPLYDPDLSSINKVNTNWGVIIPRKVVDKTNCK